MMNDTVKEITLAVNTQLHTGVRVKGVLIAEENWRVWVDYEVAHMAYIITLSLLLPGERPVRRVLAEYPTTWWDAVKARLGLRHSLTQVWQKETVVYPTVPVPKLAKTARIYVQTGATAYDV